MECDFPKKKKKKKFLHTAAVSHRADSAPSFISGGSSRTSSQEYSFKDCLVVTVDVLLVFSSLFIVYLPIFLSSAKFVTIMSFGSLEKLPLKKVDLTEDDNKLPIICNNNNDVIINSTPVDGGNSGSSWSFIGHVLKTTILCMVFMLVGPALILLNKHIMQQLSFPYPMFLSGLGVLTS